MDVVKKIESTETDVKDAPIFKVVITNSGMAEQEYRKPIDPAEAVEFESA